MYPHNVHSKYIHVVSVYIYKKNAIFKIKFPHHIQTKYPFEYVFFFLFFQVNLIRYKALVTLMVSVHI